MSDKQIVAKPTPAIPLPNSDAPTEQKDTKNLDDLWKEAVDRVQKENGVKIPALSEIESDELQQPDKRLEKATELFKTSRHPEDRKSKVIKAVSGCLDWTYSGVTFFKDHVSGTYAAPAQIVAGSVLYMIKAAKNMTADFDLIESTFVELHNALLDIGDLSKREFRESNFLNKLMDIFVALLDFCLFSGKMFTEYRRKRLYLNALLQGRNKKIMDRCEKVKMTIILFRAAVPFQILDVVKAMDSKIEDLPANLLDLLQHEKIKPSDLQALWGKTTSLEKITKVLKDNKDLDPDIIVPIQIHMEFLKAHLVPGTFSWIENEPAYKSWMSGHKTPVIYVCGATGTGKTFFSYRCFMLIQEQAKKHRLEARSEGNKNNPRQTTLVTYFPFEPGRQDSQSFRNVLAYILVQIADDDSKLADSIAKDLAAYKIGKEEDNIKKLNFMWEKLLIKKFEKTPDVSRVVYIILDGVELMDAPDREAMLRLFQTLNSDKDGIRILMTGPPDEDIFGPIARYTDCPKIDLLEKTRSNGDFVKLIDSHFNKSEILKSFKDSTKNVIKTKLLDSPERVMSSVDLTLTMLEQCDGDASALMKIDHVKGQHGLYTAMIDTVCSKRSPRDREIVEKIFALCAFAKEPFKVLELEQLLEQETTTSNFDVAAEIEGRLSSLLYTDSYRSTGLSEITSAPKAETENDEIEAQQKRDKNKQKQVRFRQPAFKDYLEQSSNNMIRDPIKAKVDIFLKLVSILCDQLPQGASKRDSLQEYAADWLLAHLEDIDVKATTPQQGAQVVNALMRILYDDNDVSRVFEEIQSRKDDLLDVYFSIYGISNLPQEDLGYRHLNLLLAWAKKMSFHNEEKMTFIALQGIESVLRDPRCVLEALGRGHLMRWTEKMTYREAKISYNFICRSLWLTGKLDPDSTTSKPYFNAVTPTIAKALIKYGKDELYTNPVEVARCRIATALVLHNESTDDARQLCVELYRTNLSETTTLGPEKFYSYLGIAEYYRALIDISSNEDEEKKNENWKNVVSFADKALIERSEEKGALGSELRNERCIKAFLLKSEALTQLGLDAEAIQTCEEALSEELEYTPEMLEFLKTIIDIHTKKSEWTKVIQAVQRQRPRVRSEWLWARSDNFTDKKDSLRRAAVETRRVDFTIRTFEEAIEYWQTREIGCSVVTQTELAVVYRRDARATKMAENEFDRLITRLVENRVSLWLVDCIFPDMIDIHYENFTMTESNYVKRQIIGQVEKMIDRYENMQIVEPLTIGKALYVLAEMWASLDSRLKAKQCAERVFALCIADLEDTIGANDAAAFRLLAKVLMAANLEIDAKIALSLQFSYVSSVYDDTYRKKDVAMPVRTSESAKEETPVQNGEQPVVGEVQPEPGNPETASQKVEENAYHLIAPVVSIASGKFDEKDIALPTQVVEFTDVKKITDDGKTNCDASEASDSKESPNGLAVGTSPLPASSGDEHSVPETAKVGPTQLDPISATNGSGQDNSTTESQKKPANELVDISIYQDLIDDEVLCCSGQCVDPAIEVRSFGPKSEKMYYCLDCADVQYCEPCYQTQIKFYDNYEEGFWFKSCWARHRFISMPIDQWLGVKDGVIRIGKKEKLWKDWLLSVKSRWKRRMNEEEVSNHSSTTLASV